MNIDFIETTTQVIRGELLKPAVSMEADIYGNYSATVIFTVLNDSLGGNKTLTIKIPKEEWNVFWTNFNNGRYLLDLLKAKYDIADLTIPDSIEEWFINL